MQLCWSLDKIGPICRSADDCGLVLAAIHGADPRDAASVDRPYVWPSSREISTIRVGYVAKGDEDEQRADFRVLRELGVKLVPVEPPNLKFVTNGFRTAYLMMTDGIGTAIRLGIRGSCS
jgi:Asp-tRNA(Asn)/Glu-tRNA(Gln) amidotransferase A subunit family amidase